MTQHRIYTTSFASVYPHYVAKAEKKGRTRAEVDEIISWLTGYGPADLERILSDKTDFETFFAKAPALNPARASINCVTPEGKVIRQEPAKFGSIGNGHHVDLDGPWTHTYEPLFNRADAYFPHLISELLQLESKYDAPAAAGRQRFSEPVTLTAEAQQLWSECIASLVVRSPNFRNKIRNTVNYYGAYKDGVSGRHHIIAINLGRCFPYITRSIEQCGLKYVIFSDHKEFVFGDGFLHNFSSWGAPNHWVKLLVPLTPTVAVACVSPSGAYQRGIRTIRLNHAEVAEVNFATQVYSQRQLFFRSQPPEVNEAFRRAQFLEFRYHEFDLLDQLARPFTWDHIRR